MSQMKKIIFLMIFGLSLASFNDTFGSYKKNYYINNDVNKQERPQDGRGFNDHERDKKNKNNGECQNPNQGPGYGNGEGRGKGKYRN